MPTSSSPSRRARRGPASAIAVAAALIVAAVALPGPPDDLGFSLARAEPRFAVRSGARCALCHVNPSGAGARNRYGRGVFEHQDLAVKRWQGSFLARAPFDPQVTDWLALGADVRFAYAWDRLGEAPPGVDRTALNTFFLMQADLYTTAELGDFLTLYLDVGALGNFEAFLMLSYGLGDESKGDAEPAARDAPPQERSRPLAFYLKAGSFVPAYGLRLSNHSAFIREPMNIHPGFRDVGLEAGVLWSALSLQVGYYLGKLNRSDETRGSSVAVRLEGMHRLRWVNLLFGVSLHYLEEVDTNPLIKDYKPKGRVEELRAGGFAGVSLGRFTYLGEVDIVRAEGGDQGDALAYASYQELSFVPLQGLDLILSYEFTDPNAKFGDNGVHRVGGSARLFPLLFFEVLAQYRRTISAVAASSGRQDLTIMLHGFF